VANASYITCNDADMTLLQFMRPIERGYITDTFTQGAIWERVLGSKMLGIDLKAGGIAGRSSVIAPRDCSMLLTTQPFMPRAIEVRHGPHCKGTIVMILVEFESAAICG
jgi:hypothetical protein